MILQQDGKNIKKTIKAIYSKSSSSLVNHHVHCLSTWHEKEVWLLSRTVINIWVVFLRQSLEMLSLKVVFGNVHLYLISSCLSHNLMLFLTLGDCTLYKASLFIYVPFLFCRQSWPTKIDMHQDIEDSLASSSISHAGGPQTPARSTENLLNGHRIKGLLEVSRREEISEASSSSAALPPNPLKPWVMAPLASAPAKQQTCLFRVEEDEEEEEQEPLPLPTQVVLRRKPLSITNRLTSRKSAPVLNQIFEEEGESDDDFDMDESLPPKLSRLKMNMASPGTAQKRYHRRKSQGRGSSCSSSETSDDDSESHRRRLDKDTGFTYSKNRRDSSEGPPGNSGGNGGGSSGGQSKPPGEDNSGPDKGSPPGGGNGGSTGGGSGGGGSTKGQGGPSSCSRCSNNNASSGSTRCAARSAGELVESLKLMSLCLSSQFQHRSSGGGGGGRFILDPQSLSSIKVQERSSWKMCIGSNNSLDKVINPALNGSIGAMEHYQDQTAVMLNELGLVKENNLNLKNNVLQLPLCEKTISVNIQRSPRDGLLCASAQATCCQVIWRHGKWLVLRVDCSYCHICSIWWHEFSTSSCIWPFFIPTWPLNLPSMLS